MHFLSQHLLVTFWQKNTNNHSKKQLSLLQQSLVVFNFSPALVMCTTFFCVAALLFVTPHYFGVMALCIVLWRVFLCWSIVVGSAALHHAACFVWCCIIVHVPAVVVALLFWHKHKNNNNNQPLWHWSSMLFVVSLVVASFHCDFLLQWLLYWHPKK